MLSSTTSLSNTNLNTSIAFRRHTSTYPFSKFVTTTNQNPSSLSFHPDLPEDEEEMAFFNSSIRGSCGENIYDDGRKKNVSYPSSPRSSAILVEEAQQHQQLSINNKRKMAMMISEEEEEEEDHLSSSEDSTSEGSLREEEDVDPSALKNDKQERQIQEPDDMMSTSSAVASLVVEEENTTMNDPTSSSSNSIVRRKKQTNKKRKLTVRFDLVPAVGARPSNEKKSTTMRRMKKSFGQPKKKSSSSSSSSSSTTTTDTCTYNKRIYDDDYRSTLWWTPKELKHIEVSAVFALKMKELGLFPPIIADTDILSLQRYTKQNRMQRKNIRKQMYLTVQAVKEFETITKTKTPPELLSELLQRITTGKPTTTFMEPVATIVNSNSNSNASANANSMGGVIRKQATTQK